MVLTRKQFLDVAGRGALGAAAYSSLGFLGRAEGGEAREGAASAGTSEREFSFHASASALGGLITRPFNEVIEVQAASALTRVGGYDSARVENFRYREFVSFKSGHTQVVGSEHTECDQRKVHETLASAVVEGLDILSMVTADRVVARLTSRRPVDAPITEPLSMLPVGSYFENLRIAGVPIQMKIHDRLVKCDTKPAIERERDYFYDPDEGGRMSSQERLRLSIFEDSGLLDEAEDIKGQKGGRRERIPGATTNKGCRIVIPGFGKIYLGEFFAEPHSRELSMIRVELGSPEAGKIVVCGVQGDGRPY